MNVIDREAIQPWLVTNLAEQLGMEPQDIDICHPFSEYGLDSITGVSLAGDLQEWLGLELSPTLLWDYPSIETLAQYLAEAITGTSDATVDSGHVNPIETRGVTAEQEQAGQLLVQLDDLSDEDVDRLLNRLLATEPIAA